ncbi:MAG: efflux RND transporter periplasmic adaptor subunit [Candidatus Pacebacteria bacterium]|nr:efflux RND transporter periplasmic adaptor subunit [Candidatus Paceibacterota bacterium]
MIKKYIILAKEKIKKRKKFLWIALFVLLIFSIFWIINRDPKIDREVVEVLRGDITKEIFEVGMVKRGEEISLSFRSGGEINSILFREGDQIVKGETIASLNNSITQIRLEKAKKAFSSAKIAFSKLQAGSDKDVLIAQTSLTNAKNELDSAILNLEKVNSITETRLNNLHQDSLSLIDSATMISRVSSNLADTVSRVHFSNFITEDSRKGLSARDKIRWSFNSIKTNQSLLNIKLRLKVISEEIDIILDVLETPTYYSSSESERALLLAQKNSINQSLASVISILGKINSAKILGESEILAAETQESRARGAFVQASNQFEKIKSPAREESLRLAKLEMEQAELQIRLLEATIRESLIIAPFSGRVIRVKARIGETISAGSPVITIIADKPYQIEINVYEGDIIDVEIGNPVQIEVIAFPDKVFNGEIIFIDYAPRIINGVVYYRVIADISDYPKAMMIGMTVDATIIPAKKSNVLFLPIKAIKEYDGKSKVFLLDKNEDISEVIVETGLNGSNRMIELISGVSEGDRVIIK